MSDKVESVRLTDELGDRELLELAAKAAGLDYRYADGEIRYGNAAMKWNPLVNDGQALRLAVKLYMNLDVSTKRVCALRAQLPGSIETGDDMMAMMRRAITREAAALGSK